MILRNFVVKGLPWEGCVQRTRVVRATRGVRRRRTLLAILAASWIDYAFQYSRIPRSAKERIVVQ